MEDEKTKQKPNKSKKYNAEAMKAYNFDNMNFDFDFADIDDKKHK
jgi:hypothetical protein